MVINHSLGRKLLWIESGPLFLIVWFAFLRQCPCSLGCPGFHYAGQAGFDLERYIEDILCLLKDGSKGVYPHPWLTVPQ